MLSFIVLGLTAMLIQTQKAFKTGIKQNTITDSGRSIMDMITSDLRQMSDAGNPYYETNFFWGVPSIAMVTNFENGVAIRTNELNDIFILEHTNTIWIAVGYSVSNYSPNLGVGALYRYETNWTSLAPTFTNFLSFPFFQNLNSTTPGFTNAYWHKVADGVIDLKVRAFDQYGNEPYYTTAGYYYNYHSSSFSEFFYPIFNSANGTPTNMLPNSVELEFGILEPDTLVQLRGLAGNETALMNFLSSNAAPKMEIFRQRVTIAAATR